MLTPSTSFLLPCYLGCGWDGGHWCCHIGPRDGNRVPRMAEEDRRKAPEHPEATRGTPRCLYSGCSRRERETSTDFKPLILWRFYSQNFILTNLESFKGCSVRLQGVGLSLYNVYLLFPEILMIIHEQDSVLFKACFSDLCSTEIVSKWTSC